MSVKAGDRIPNMTPTVKLITAVADRFLDDREEAIAAVNSLGAIRLPLKAMALRLTLYCITLFTVMEIGGFDELATACVLFLIAGFGCLHTGVTVLFVLTSATVFPIAEILATSSPSRAGRDQITSGSTTIARTIGIPTWLPLLWAIASISICDLHRICARAHFLIGAKLPPK